MKVKDLLIAHDIDAFREFIKTEGSALIPGLLCKEIAEYSDGKLSALMHTLKANQPYLGQEHQDSRNVFRRESLQADIENALDGGDVPLNLKLAEYARAHLGYPLCHTCEYFRTAPEGEKPCMMIGSMPGDVCCAGWQPIKENAMPSSA